MSRRFAAACSFCLILTCATFVFVDAANGQSPTPQSPMPPPSDTVSLDRIRAGVQRSTFLGGERLETYTPTFRTEVVQPVIKLRDYWSDRDPDKEPDPFMYPIPSAAELLIDAVVVKPRAALAARKRRAIKKQIQEELRQIEEQRNATPAGAASPEAASPAAAPVPPPRPRP